MADTGGQQFFSLITDIGRWKLAKAAADKGQLQITHFAVGDGGGAETSPVPSRKSLVHEVWRTQIESIEIDPKNPAAVLVSAVIPRDIGGWWMREFGLFDVTGAMIAVVKPAPNYKARVAEGQNEDIIYQFQLLIGENAQVVAVIDPSVLYATRDYVEKRSISPSQLSNAPWLPVLSMTVSAPPANAQAGDTYLIPENASGAWAGKAGQLAIAQGGGAATADGAATVSDKWLFAKPKDGHGIGLPNGDVYIRRNGAYALYKPLSRLAELTDIDNAGKASLRAILTRAKTGYTFLTPQEAFDGVHVPAANVDGLDLSPYGRLKAEQTWTGKNTYSAETRFNASVSMAALTASGSAVLNGPLTANGEAVFNKTLNINGEARFNKNLILSDPYNEAWAFLNFWGGNAGKARGRVIRWSAKDAPSQELGYREGGGFYFWVEGVGDVFSIADNGEVRLKIGKNGYPTKISSWDGNIGGQIWNELFGQDNPNDKEDDWAAQRIRGYIDGKINEVYNNSVHEMKTSGYWEMMTDGKDGWGHYAGGAAVVSYADGRQKKFGWRSLWYRVGNDWRQPWFG